MRAGDEAADSAEPEPDPDGDGPDDGGGARPESGADGDGPDLGDPAPDDATPDTPQQQPEQQTAPAGALFGTRSTGAPRRMRPRKVAGVGDGDPGRRSRARSTRGATTHAVDFTTGRPLHLFGTVLALMRLSGKKWLDVPATIYVNGMRSIPLVMVILWFFLLVPAIIGRPIGAEVSAVITFIAFEAAYFSEIMRAGIQSVPRGQVYAGQALGMTYSQNMKLVVLPQAFRNMLPVLLTQTIILFQDTSLVYAIGAYDMLKGFEVAGKNFGRPIEAYLAAAVLYFVMCYALSWAVKRLHQKIAIIR